MPRTTSGDKVIVSGNEIGSQFPTNRMEINKEIVLDGRDGAFSLEGGAFSPNLQILGGGVVKGPVFASETVQMKNDGSQGKQLLLSGVTAQKSVVSRSTGSTAINQSLASSMNGLRFVVRGDIVSGERIDLNDTCVVGSLKAPQVTLKHSLVLGTTFADYHIECCASTIGMYQSSTITFRGPCSIFAAGGQSTGQPSFKKYDEKQQLRTTLRYIPLCRVKNVGCQMGIAPLEECADAKNAEDMKKYGVGISCGTWYYHHCSFYEDVSLGMNDFYEIPKADLPVLGKDKKIKSLWVLGILGRAFSIEKLNQQNKSFLRILHGIFAFEHLSPEQREEEKRIWDQFLSPDELNLMNMVTMGLEY